MIRPRLSGFNSAPQTVFQPRLLARNARDALVFPAALPVTEVIDLLHRQGEVGVLGLW